LAMFETMKHWLLYTGIGSYWGSPIPFAWLFRNDSLRAQVSAGHSITLGETLVVGFGFWLYLGSQVRSKLWRVVVPGSLWVGMLVTFARAPWVVGVVIFLVYGLFNPRGKTILLRGFVLMAIVAGVLLVSPFGERVIAILPFVGTHAQESVTYRELFATRAWQEIQLHPIIGNPLVLKKLEDLRQGQGIIDLVNTYAAVGMFYGIVGLSAFLGPFLIALWSVFGRVKQSADDDPDASMLGLSLFACTVGMLVEAGTVPMWQNILLYLLLGILVGYGRIREAYRARPLVPQIQ
jgi:hypothetical protein